MLNVTRWYYQNKYQGRRLVWQPMLGQCVVKVAFPKGRKELALSQLQVGAVTLLDAFTVGIAFFGDKLFLNLYREGFWGFKVVMFSYKWYDVIVLLVIST